MTTNLLSQMADDPIPEYADVFTKADWIASVKNGSFIPYDGSGYWATATHMSGKHDSFKTAPDWATHVAWFNK